MLRGSDKIDDVLPVKTTGLGNVSMCTFNVGLQILIVFFGFYFCF